MQRPRVPRETALVQGESTRSVITRRTNLLAVAQDALGGNFSKLAGPFLHESPTATQLAVSSLLPVIIAGIARKGARPQGAAELLSLLEDASLDTTSLDDVVRTFIGNRAGVNSLLKQGTKRFVPALFGESSGALASALASASGIKSSSATNLLAMLVPLILGLLKKYIGSSQRNAEPLAALLSGQGLYLQAALDSRLTRALGFASSAAFLGGLGGGTADAVKRESVGIASGTGAAASAAPSSAGVVTTATKSTLTPWLPWVVAAITLFFLLDSLLG